MCGRFNLFASGEEVAERFQLAEAYPFTKHIRSRATVGGWEFLH